MADETETMKDVSHTHDTVDPQGVWGRGDDAGKSD